MSARLEEMAQEIMGIAWGPFGSPPRRRTRRQAERPVKAVIARIFAMGRDAGWDAAIREVEARIGKFPDGWAPVRPQSWSDSWKDAVTETQAADYAGALTETA